MTDIAASVEILTDKIEASAEVNPGVTDPYSCIVLNSEISQAERQTLQRVASVKTGQTISYTEGDDGDREDGRGVDFLTLDCNNPFGNNKMFTDENGLQVYGNNYMIDHQREGLGWYLGIVGLTQWEPAMELALAATNCGYNDWFIPNLKQWVELYNAGETKTQGRPFDYEPINSFGHVGFVCWTSTTRHDLPTSANTIADVTSTIIAGVLKTYTRRVVICRKHY